MKTIKLLLAGESWVSSNTHMKGWDFFSSTTYETGISYIKKALENTNIELIHMPSHIAATEFPLTIEELKKYDVVCLSDIGSNTLLLHPDTWLKGKPVPNRLKLISDWVRGGGGLVMCGGYYSFAGIYGAAKYYQSPLEPILPVKISTFDDRIETPEGSKPRIIDLDHEIVKNIDTEWPMLLGYNELKIQPMADLIVEIGGHPLLAVMDVDKGRSMVWASDIGPHWCPISFAEWNGYAKLWQNAISWLAKK